MLQRSIVVLNAFLTKTRAHHPLNVIRSGPKYWSDPERLYQYKLLYFAMGVDQQPLRRTAVLLGDKHRLQTTSFLTKVKKDPTGFERARAKQTTLWHRRMQYQEYYMQHLMTRHAWGLLRMYPPGGGKIAGKVDDGYFGYDDVPYHRYNRQPLPFPAKEIYEPRK